MSFIGNPLVSQAFVTDSFSGNGSTTAFTMSVAPATTAAVLVAISGVVQDPSTYSIVGTTLTFSQAPPSATANISTRYLGIPSTGVTSTAYRTVTEFTATAAQTTFTPPSFTPGFVNVYRNGVLLGSADYVASSGTTVVLNAAATLNDLVTVESFLVSSILNISSSVNQLLTTPTITSPIFSGNVGIGTASPTSLLHVEKSFTGTIVKIKNNAGATSSDAGLEVETSTTGTKTLLLKNAGTETFSVRGDGVAYHSGSVGIGTTSTLNYTAGGTYKTLSIDAGTSADARAEISLAGGGGGLNYNMGRINFGLSSNTTNAAAIIQGLSSAAGASTGGNLVFYTASDISSGTVTEKMRLTSNGYALFTNNGSYPDGSNLPYHYFNSNTSGAGAGDRVLRIRANSTSFAGFVFEAFGGGNTTNSTYTIAAFTNGNASGAMYVRDSGNVVNTNNSYGSSSDIILKENIIDTTPKLSDLMNVKIRNYNLKIKPQEKHIGVIAQELETVFPSLVEEDADGIKGVKYSVFVPILIKAIQELSAEVTALKAKVGV